KTNEDEELLTVMTRKEIDASWGQSKTKQTVHKNFPQEMAKRTVINRAAKDFINTSDDSDLLVDAINNSTENEYDNNRGDVTPETEAQQQISEKANSEELDFDDTLEDAEYTEVEEETKQDPAQQNQSKKERKQENLFESTGSEGLAF